MVWLSSRVAAGFESRRRRLKQIERQLGIPLRQAELEIALRLEALYGISCDPRE